MSAMLCSVFWCIGRQVGSERSRVETWLWGMGAYLVDMGKLSGGDGDGDEGEGLLALRSFKDCDGKHRGSFFLVEILPLAIFTPSLAPGKKPDVV